MKINHRVTELHPEGWFLFCIRSCEATTSEFKGKTSNRLKWTVEGTERVYGGQKQIMSVWTGTEMLTDERCKLLQLARACGLDAVDVEDTDNLLGAVFAGKVAHGEGERAGLATIVQFDTQDRIRPAKYPPLLANRESDPFSDE